MWLIIILIATSLVSINYFLLKKYREKLKLGLLSLMLWGTSLIVLIDHLIAFVSGEQFIKITTDGLIKSGTILGFVMIIPIFVIWIIAVYISFNTKSSS